MTRTPGHDREALRAALEHADLRVLLMVVFHLSGDHRWLAAPFHPRRDVRLIADEDAGLDDTTRRAIREAAFDLLTRERAVPAIDDPGDDLMVEMMSVCLGERVPDEYAPMMREEIGFTSRDVEWPGGARPAAADAMPVLIVGAGASGIALAAKLERLGIPYEIAERHAELGGTWHENRYPGCGVDTPNHAYSYSFGTRYRWSRFFSEREQLHDYLLRCADEFGVRPNIHFETSVTGMRWDEASGCWNVTTRSRSGSETRPFRAVVSAIGQFGEPSIPAISGASTFPGPLFHTTAWPTDLDLTGKRVALVGTGATSMQIAPTIADDVAALTIYQRTPQWARSIPRYHEPIPEEAQWLLETVPFYAPWFRFTMLWRYGDGLLPFLRKDPDWPHPERSLNRVNDRHRAEMTDHIRSRLADRPELVEACLPTYPPYGKRILLDNGWYDAIRKRNVELVAAGVDRIEGDELVDAQGGRRAADIVVLATGFEMAQMTSRLGVIGRNGRDLADVWADDDPTAYLGITVPGFPNLFIMQGPNSGLGHGGSAILQSECQARYISAALALMVTRGIRALDVEQERHDDYVRRVDAEHEQLVWTHPGVSTYYRNRHGRVVSVSPWRLVDYWAMTHDPDLSDYDVTTA